MGAIRESRRTKTAGWDECTQARSEELEALIDAIRELDDGDALELSFN